MAERSTGRAAELRVFAVRLPGDGGLYPQTCSFRWRGAGDDRIKRSDFDVCVRRAAHDDVVWIDEVVLSTGYVGA